MIKIGAEVVKQIGARSGAAVQFRKSEDISDMLRETTACLNGSASGAVVLANDSEVPAEVFLEEQNPDVLLEAARSTLASGEVTTNSERLVIALPIKYGAERKIFGVVGLDWCSEVLCSTVEK